MISDRWCTSYIVRFVVCIKRFANITINKVSIQCNSIECNCVDCTCVVSKVRSVINVR